MEVSRSSKGGDRKDEDARAIYENRPGGPDGSSHLPWDNLSIACPNLSPPDLEGCRYGVASANIADTRSNRSVGSSDIAEILNVPGSCVAGRPPSVSASGVNSQRYVRDTQRPSGSAEQASVRWHALRRMFPSCDASIHISRHVSRLPQPPRHSLRFPSSRYPRQIRPCSRRVKLPLERTTVMRLARKCRPHVPTPIRPMRLPRGHAEGKLSGLHATGRGAMSRHVIPAAVWLATAVTIVARR